MNCIRFEILTFKVLHCNLVICHVLFTQFDYCDSLTYRK